MEWKDVLEATGENPLETLPDGGGFCGIFRRIAVIGDSLSAGELQTNPALGPAYHDYHEYSWGQYLARQTGATVYVFAHGGMTAREYCNTRADCCGYWDRKYQCQAYILALGLNDVSKYPIGTVQDIDFADYRNNQETFCGYYGKIIQRYKQIEPNARFFLMTAPRGNAFPDEIEGKLDAHADALREMAARFSNTYVLDFRKFAPRYDDAFREKFFLYGHMNPAGYLLTARMVSGYIDWIIRRHMRDFSQVGLIGTPYYEP